MPPVFETYGLPVLHQPDTAFACCPCTEEHYPCKNCFPVCGTSYPSGVIEWPRIENYSDTMFEMPTDCAAALPGWRTWDGFLRYASPSNYGPFCIWYLTRGNVYDGTGDPIWTHNSRLLYNVDLTFWPKPGYAGAGEGPTWWLSVICTGANTREVWIGKKAGGDRDPRGVYTKVGGIATRGTVTIGAGRLPP